MYRVMAIISLFVRQFCIPNPFEALGAGLMVNIEGSSVLLTPNMLNWIVGLFLPGLTFGVVGMYYESGSAPVLGSLLYLVFFIIHNFILWVISLLGFATWAIVLIVVLYIGCHVLLLSRGNRFIAKG